MSLDLVKGRLDCCGRKSPYVSDTSSLLGRSRVGDYTERILLVSTLSVLRSMNLLRAEAKQRLVYALKRTKARIGSRDRVGQGTIHVQWPGLSSTTVQHGYLEARWVMVQQDRTRQERGNTTSPRTSSIHAPASNAPHGSATRPLSSRPRRLPFSLPLRALSLPATSAQRRSPCRAFGTAIEPDDRTSVCPRTEDSPLSLK
ncbi:uncharacterized protein C8Q71DRAFT_63321 [Rhodofomes roseus]|uniref:Uncharacterized protein n=1 Tax=Rhodofomes roseus TaxID=34475 RepID=A0ABQ8KEA3_9APHY|nr:uncharacterized protein C8Q71DRAFT_63321 [Rhodofomes roseus]KAH9836037.1 hypothetical protein C8Q71DRAFT_63321 [Rhodofomes roseus]